MSTSVNNFDSIERMIFDEGIRIEAVDIHPELDVMIIVLNTKVALRQTISAYKLLAAADAAQLLQYEITGAGTGISWPQLDEDLSLKGFLKDELRSMVNRKDAFAA